MKHMYLDVVKEIGIHWTRWPSYIFPRSSYDAFVPTVGAVHSWLGLAWPHWLVFVFDHHITPLTLIKVICQLTS